MLETCIENWNKYIRKKELCIKLVIYKNGVSYLVSDLIFESLLFI